MYLKTHQHYYTHLNKKYKYDIAAEEMDTMVKNSLEPKDVNKYISVKVREMFFEVYNNYDNNN